MSLNLIPPLLFFAIVLFTHPTANASLENFLQWEKGSPDVESVDKDDELEYTAIYHYITSKFKKIKEEEAQIISRHLVDYGKEHALDPKFAAALIARESSFNKDAVSSTGAKGLGQIKDFNFQKLEIDDPFDIKQNVKGTMVFLKNMLGKWKDQSEKAMLALASYYNGYTATKQKGGAVSLSLIHI